MGVSFRMDGWLGNSGFQPDGEDAVGTGRASIGGIRSLQLTQSRKSTSSIDSIEKIDSIDRLSRLSRLNRLNREKNADERSEAAKTPRMERQRSPARRRGRRRDRLGGAVSARRRGIGLFECSLVMGGGVFSLATFALVSLATFLPLVSRLFSFLSCSRPLLVPKSSGHFQIYAIW